MAKSKKSSWFIKGTAGIILFGSGLSIAIESSVYKHSDEPWYTWVVGGTAGIALAVSGIIFMIKSGILEREMERKKPEKD